MDWTALAQDRDRWQTLVNAAMNILVPQNAGNFLAIRGLVSFSGRTLLHGVIFLVTLLAGDRGGTVLKVLCYKSEGRWFDPRWCH